MSTAGIGERAWIVSGRVQGVGFRWSTVREARRLELSGGVWNRPDGRVEVHARGSGEALSAFQSWLEAGPPGARVEALDPIPPGDAARRDGFAVLRG